MLFCIAIVKLLIYNCVNKILGGVTMAKTANINLRIEPSTKAKAEALFSSFGITVTDAINIFFPFQIKQPRYNHQTEVAMQEARDIIAGKIQSKSYSTVEELFKDLDGE